MQQLCLCKLEGAFPVVPPNPSLVDPSAQACHEGVSMSEPGSRFDNCGTRQQMKSVARNLAALIWWQ